MEWPDQSGGFAWASFQLELGLNRPDDPVKGSNTRGTITFAQTAMPNSRSAQFFINFGDNSQLDGQRFAPFGKVIEGMDVVDTISKASRDRGDRPVTPIKMNKITVSDA